MSKVKPIYAHFIYGFTRNGVRNYQMLIRCGVTIECRPPYIKGERDSLWIYTNHLPKKTDKEACERLAGMTLEAL